MLARPRLRCAGWLWLGALLGGCAAVLEPAERATLAVTLIDDAGWQAQTIDTGRFRLLAARAPRSGRVLTVYIEGDGLAWLARDTVSPDPTPGDPLALRLALAQPGDGAVAWLARPCQFYGRADATCDVRYWAGARFAPEVVAAMSRAVGRLKADAGAEHLRLVGYSGGAAVAALVAAERRDVVGLYGVAGVLDLVGWTALHRASPMAGSLDPSTRIAALAGMPQVQWAGTADTVVPPALVEDWAARFPPGARPRVVAVPGFDHRCCWVEVWPGLWRIATGEGAGE